MKRFALTLLLPAIFLAPVRLAADPIAEVKRADAARVRATIAGDGKLLGDLLSDDLSYGQNEGRVQSKREFIEAVVSNQVKYDAYDYEDVKFLETAPHVVTMTGRVRLKVRQGNTRAEFGLRFLAVWKEENGQWRLHAYQSARLPEPASPTAKPPPESGAP